MPLESRAIVIPSRLRSHNMPKMLASFPDAYVTVDEREKSFYMDVVPSRQLILHPPFESIPQIRNWILATFQEDCIVQIDDDFKKVVSFGVPGTSRPHSYTDPADLKDIIDAAHWPAQDADLGVFCWSRIANPIGYRPFDPVALYGTPVMCAFGMRGRARNRQFDDAVRGMADIDFTMRTHLVDRIMFTDTRFYWDFGKIFSGEGGNQGNITLDHRKNAVQLIRSRWKKYISIGHQKNFGPNSPMRRKKDTQSVSIRIPRKSQQAVSGLRGIAALQAKKLAEEEAKTR
jgi:hypothetical protein